MGQEGGFHVPESFEVALQDGNQKKDKEGPTKMQIQRDQVANYE